MQFVYWVQRASLPSHLPRASSPGHLIGRKMLARLSQLHPKFIGLSITNEAFSEDC